MTRIRDLELWLAFITMLGIALVYLGIAAFWRQFPPARELVGHSLGILGFLLMLMTETLYSLRKRMRAAHWGRMSTWLSFHIYTGLVGPFLVLLHSAWKFNGLAGVVTLMMLIVVASGFFGRYIFTAIPRTADGIELSARALGQEIQRLQAALASWLPRQPEALQNLVETRFRASPSARQFVFARALQDWSDRWRWRLVARHYDASTRRQAGYLLELAIAQRRLRGQLASLALARRLLALWHAVHVPLGMAMFTAAFIHILGAIYYATLLR